MAQLFIKQAKQYSVAWPNYPDELFQFIASKTPDHELAWDVGTGTGQAALPLAKINKSVVATDTNPKQLEFAAKLPNVWYKCTPAKMPMAELEEKIAGRSSVDLVTIAQALHWFDFPFEPLEGLDDTGPIQFKVVGVMDLQRFFTYIRSWSAYQTARKNGVELLTDDVVKDFTNAWEEDGKPLKLPLILFASGLGELGI